MVNADRGWTLDSSPTQVNRLPVNPSFVAAMGWILATAPMVLLVLTILFVKTESFPWTMVIIIIIPSSIGALAAVLANRYYYFSAALVCFTQIILVVALSLFAFGMYRTVTPLALLWGITVAGLVLGRVFMLILIGVAAALLSLAFFLDSNHWVPLPVLRDEGQLAFVDVVVVFICLAAFYPLISVFTSVIARALTEVKARAELEASLNLQLTSLHQTEQSLSHEVNSMSGELASQAKQQSQMAVHQAARAEELSQMLVELNQATQAITAAAAEVAAAARQARDNAERGRGATNDAAHAVEVMRVQVETMSAQIGILTEQTKQINAVLELMTEVAGETHLLSLNAQLEAAGAGQAGWRFAVVAEEVRELAQRSQSGVEQVEALVRTISVAASAAVAAAAVGLQQAIAGAELTARADQAHQEILGAVEQTAALAQQISATTTQQRSASEQAVGRIEQFSQEAQQAASASAVMLEAVRQMNTVAEQLAHTSSVPV